MTVKVVIDNNAKEVFKELKFFQQRHIPRILTDSINEVGVKSVNALRSQLAKKLDNPVKKTITSPRFFFAKLQADPFGTVFIVDKSKRGKSPAEYLRPLLSGGIKTPDKQFVMTPTKHTPRNKHGNITAGNRKKFFTDKAKYFVGVPKGQPTAGFGVWERYGRASSMTSSGYKIRKVLNLTRTQRFTKRFDFFKTVKGVVTNNITKILDRNIRKYV